MAINKNDFDMAKWILDQAIYHGNALSLQDAMMVRAFLSALEEHRDAPTENVKSREWRAMVYRKLLEDPAALSQFTQEALRKYTPDELVGFLHPSILQAVRERYPQQLHTEEDSLEEVLANTSGEELFDILQTHGRIPDIIDYILEHNPEYAKRHLGFDDAVSEGYDTGHEQGYESGTEEGYNQGHADGQSEGYERGLEDSDG